MSSFTQTARSAKTSFEYTEWKEKLARIGHAAKGIVYGIAGVLTLMAAFNMGGQKAGKTQVIDFLQKQAFGQVLVILMGIGLACYAFYRFVQVAGKSEKLQDKSDLKRTALKVGFFISGIIYLGFAYYAISQVLGSSGSSGSSKGLLSSMMEHSWGIVVIYIASGLLLIKAIYQFVKVANKEYYEGVRGMNVGVQKAKSIVRKAGAIGFIARGILIGITAYFFFQAANTHDASQVQGTSGAFSFLQQSSSGPWLMAAVALGLIGYSVYMIIVSRYKNFHIR
ncbi:DUF1206 domain-containing protein [Fulvivirga maritima]|uniref:DUF1206 domain-containing protein n=1 Tax=Fulvivirga maritima TaxID=2904247 RepID=UPI001F322F5B|nr:DUF1206 domain-containing protein [Fulvivirga maritima]UII25387.1 DUF1206 domain-containing protein [Fulvivirga maritima]